MKKISELPEELQIGLAIAEAMSAGDCVSLERFIDQGLLDPHRITKGDQWNLLHEALVHPSKITSEPMVRYLISLGNDVNAKDVRGWTPLHFAARQKNAAAERVLIEAGADVNAKDSNGAMPLHKCLFNDPMRLDAVEVLLQHGADIAPAKKYVEVVVSPYTNAIAELVEKYDAK